MEITFLDQESKCKSEESRWYHYCASKKIPMVKTVKRSNLGDVDWDYITIPPNDEEFLFSQEEWIKSELKELLKHYQIEKTEARISSLTGFVKNIPIEHVPEFARDVCNTLSQAYKRHRQEPQ